MTQSPSLPTLHAKGSFEVKLAPLPLANAEANAHDSADKSLARMSVDKVFSGDLQGTSRGEMLSGGNPATGSAGYVAMERVDGVLAGRQGSFVLQHSGTMDRGSSSLSISIVPGSGTGGLAGISGTLEIDLTGGKHLYTLNYVLNGTAP